MIGKEGLLFFCLTKVHEFIAVLLRNSSRLRVFSDVERHPAIKLAKVYHIEGDEDLRPNPAIPMTVRSTVD